jgi:hypothetical protein
MEKVVEAPVSLRHLTFPLAALVCVLTLAPGAHALDLRVINQTTQPVAVYPGKDSHCWNKASGGLYSNLAQDHIVPGFDQKTKTNGEKTFNAGSAQGGQYSGDCYQQISIQWLDQRGQYTDPFEVGAPFFAKDIDARPYPIDGTSFRSLLLAGGPPTSWNYRFGHTPAGWMPKNPLQSGPAPATGAFSLYCLNWDSESATKVALHVQDTCGSTPAVTREPCRGQGCTSRSASSRQIPTVAGSSSAAARDQTVAPTATQKPPSKSNVTNFFPIAETICKEVRPALKKPSVPWGNECAEISKPANWGVSRLSQVVRELRQVDSTEGQIDFPLKQVGETEVYTCKASTPCGPYRYNYIQEKEELYKVDHCFSFKFGQEGSFQYETGAELDVGVEGVAQGKATTKFTVGLKLTGEENWNDCQSGQIRKLERQERGRDVTVAPHTIRTVKMFEQKADLTYTYAADLTLGKKNVAEPIRSPLPRAFGMSPSKWHPCVGYMVGAAQGADPLSYTGLVGSLNGQGSSDETVQSALDAASKFTTDDGDRCPGWPKGYRSSMAFRGEAKVTRDAGQPTSWTSALAKRGWYGLYPLPVGGDPKEDGVGQLAPYEFDECQDGYVKKLTQPDLREVCVEKGALPRAGLEDAPDEVIDGSESPSDSSLAGNPVSNLIMADDDRRLETLSGERGRDVLEGDARKQILNGGRGADYLTGGGGPDDLLGQKGSDSLYAGHGDDDLRDNGGNNTLFGGPGADDLRAGDDGAGALEGGVGPDTLSLDGDAPVGLVGGKGDDFYRLQDGADPGHAIEDLRQGRDTVQASGSFVLPPAVERGVAAPGSRVKMRAGLYSQTLVGGKRNDKLSGGPGTDRLLGRAGDDLLRLGLFGFDRATGGAGADRFVPISTPPEIPLPEDFKKGGLVTAHLITDLRPGRGDRIVLRRSSFGRKVSGLAKRMVVREGASPEPRGQRPQLLFARRGSLLRFDVDGKGELPSQVVAILAGFDHLPIRAIKVQR